MIGMLENIGKITARWWKIPSPWNGEKKLVERDLASPFAVPRNNTHK